MTKWGTANVSFVIATLQTPSDGFQRWDAANIEASRSSAENLIFPSTFPRKLIRRKQPSGPEAVEDEVSFNTGHISMFAGYYAGKMDAYGYARETAAGKDPPNGDVRAVINAWNARGYSINCNDIATGSKLSVLASATTWSFAWSTLRYIAVGDPVVRVPMISGFRLPDVSFFQNRNGISYRAGFGVKSGQTYYPMSVEYIYKGTPTAEVSFGVRKFKPIDGVFKTGSTVQGFASTAGGGGSGNFGLSGLGLTDPAAPDGISQNVSRAGGAEPLSARLELRIHPIATERAP